MWQDFARTDDALIGRIGEIRQINGRASERGSIDDPFRRVRWIDIEDFKGDQREQRNRVEFDLPGDLGGIAG